MRGHSFDLQPLEEHVLVSPNPLVLGFVVGFSMYVCCLWGGIPSSSFYGVFVAFVSRSIGYLLLVTAIGASVGHWLLGWGENTV